MENKRDHRGRPPQKPDYDPETLTRELMDTVVEVYHSTNSLKSTALELDLPPNKVKKLLITAKVLCYPETEQIQRLLNAGKSMAEVSEELHFSRAAINTYLPYSKCVYKTAEISQNAERMAKYRERKKAVVDMQENMSEENLWQCIIAFQHYPFHTASGLPFSYTLQTGRNGSYTKELSGRFSPGKQQVPGVEQCADCLSIRCGEEKHRDHRSQGTCERPGRELYL